MADNLVVDENEQKKKLEELWRKMTKAFAGYGSSSPTKDEIELLEWAARRDEMHLRVAPVMTTEQKAYFDERYIEWLNDEKSLRNIHNIENKNKIKTKYTGNKFPISKDGIVISIVFPDYKIRIGNERVPYLGHAGILIIDKETGKSTYYEYGRYDPEKKGKTRKYDLPDVKFNKSGTIEQKSLKRVFSIISIKFGQSGKIYGKMQEVDYKKAVGYAEKRYRDNINTNRKRYDLFNNNCATFASEVVRAGNGNATSFSVPNINIKYTSGKEVIYIPK